MSNIIVDWDTFNIRFMTEIVFVKEEVNEWIMYAHHGPYKIICYKQKDEDDEKNMMFVDKYLSGRKNVIKILSYEYEQVTQMLSAYEEPIIEETACEEENVGGNPASLD